MLVDVVLLRCYQSVNVEIVLLENVFHDFIVEGIVFRGPTSLVIQLQVTFHLGEGRAEILVSPIDSRLALKLAKVLCVAFLCVRHPLVLFPSTSVSASVRII